MINFQMLWSENSCRLCGVTNSNEHSVYKVVGNQTIEYKIKKCLNISIFEDDCKPKEICDLCLVKVEQFSDFIDICIEANRKFDSFILSRQNSNGNSELIQQKSVIVNLKSGNENDQRKSVALLPLESIDVTLNQDMLQIAENSNVLSTNLQENLSDYVKAVSRYVPYLPESNNTVLRHSSNIGCLALQNNFYSNHNISYDICQNNEHVEIDHNGTDFLSQSLLKNFKEIPKTINENLEIKSCIQTSSMQKLKQTEELISVESVKNKLNLINRPYQKIKPKKRFKCSHCDKIFVRRLSLNSHMALHTKRRPFICSECGKSFPIKSELTIHKKIHSAQYQCKICSKTFVVPSKLKRHLRIHTNERPFTCDFAKCGKKFSDRSNLFEHKETHKDGRHLKCASCEKYFKTKSQLKSHKLSHKSDILFTCDICKKSYKYKTTLILHMKKHKGYICPFCDLDCKKLSALVKHRRECNKNRTN